MYGATDEVTTPHAIALAEISGIHSVIWATLLFFSQRNTILNALTYSYAIGGALFLRFALMKSEQKYSTPKAWILLLAVLSLLVSIAGYGKGFGLIDGSGIILGWGALLAINSISAWLFTKTVHKLYGKSSLQSLNFLIELIRWSPVEDDNVCPLSDTGFQASTR